MPFAFDHIAAFYAAREQHDRAYSYLSMTLGNGFARII